MLIRFISWSRCNGKGLAMVNFKDRNDRVVTLTVLVGALAGIAALSYELISNAPARPHQTYVKFGCLNEEAHSGQTTKQTTFVNAVPCGQ